MARYTLILKDKTYVKLLKKAEAQGKTLGRFLNDILDEIAEGEGDFNPSVCFFCGRPAEFEGHGFKGKKLYFCSSHIEAKMLCKGWRQLHE